MSTTVDQRVVEMRFDNKQFESGVSSSMSLLDKLKQSLNLSGASKGLEEVNSAAKKMDFSGLSGAVDTVRERFTALEVMGVTALVNLTNSAVNAGKRIASALTIDPIKAGLSEYETQIGAIQTILANTESKGTTLNDVNGALDELNEYADKTIYNFTEMTRNIGTFTAAGVDLDKSVSSIKGIANLAAISGSTSQQASTAMYQLSQAMASGTVKLMDWNSVVNAGMGGQVFQDALKRTAKAHGVAIDDIIKKQGSFRESLSEGWLTADILTETLTQFTMSAKEGSKEWDEFKESLKKQGYTDEQAESILKMANTATDAATKVKTFTQLWDTLKESAQSGWSQTWEILIGDFEEAKEFLTELSDLFGGIITKSAESRNDMLENWKVLGGRDDLIQSIRNSFDAIASVINPIKDAFREIFPPITAEQLKGFTEGLKELTSKLTLSDTASENLKRTFKGLFAVVDIVKHFFVEAFDAVKSLFGGIGELGGGVLGVTANIGDFLVNLRDSIKESGIFGKVLGGMVSVIKGVFGGLKSLVTLLKDKIFEPGWETLRAFFEKLGDRMAFAGEIATGMKDGIVGAVKAIGSALERCSLMKVLEVAWNFIKAIGSALGKVFGGIADGLMGAFGEGSFSGLLDIFNTLVTGGLVAGIVKFMKQLGDTVEGLNLKEFGKQFLGKITNVLDGLRGCLEGFQQKLKSEVIMKIASAIAVLAVALLVLSVIDSDSLARSIGAMTLLFTELMAGMKIISSIGGDKGLVKVGIAMGKLASALLILSIALAIMSTLSLEDLGIGLGGIAVGLGLLVGAVNLLPDAKVKSAAKAIKTMSTALLILSVALKIMGSMSWEEMAVGLVSMTVGLGLLVAAVNLLPKDTSLKVAGLTGLAVALVIMGAALKIMGSMSWEEMAVGLVSLAGAMAILVVSLNLMTAALPGALAMMVVAPALVLLAAALKILSTLSWEQVAIGMVSLAGALTILAVGLTLMIAALPGAAALLVAAGALAILAPVLVLLGSMSWESIGKGLLALAASLTIIGVAGALLTPVIPSILGLAAAIALIGVGTLAAGIGITAFAAGLSALAVGATALVASLSVVVTGIIATVSAFVEGIIIGFGNGIVALCKVIADASPAIAEAILAVITSVCDAIIGATPKIMETVGVLLDALLSFLIEYIPKIVDAGMKMIMGLLDGIADNLPGVIQAGVDIVVAFVRGIGKSVPQVVDAGIKMIIDLINGMADAIRDNNDAMIDAVDNLMDAAIDAIKDWIKHGVSAGGDIIQGVIDGVKSMAGSLWDAMVDVASSAWDGFLEFFGIASPAKRGIEAGMFVDEGLAVGLDTYSKNVDKAALGVGEGAMDTLNDSLKGIADVFSGEVDTQPTIRPVLDLSDIRSGASDISKIFGSGASVGVHANVGAISSTMSRHGQNGGNEDVVSAINKLNKKLDNAGNTYYNIDGVTYDDGSNIAGAVKSIVRAVKVERRT